ncbi:hypothetical protein F7R01_08720 [Pseudomonas argentinensis]|uniref:Uncharacterized protein n=1 Tax=Phytopseudomonas argentinensis TaxID=289370 RepID=A0A1I3JEK9_9GAMM|nr:hypothetical protein [Pseudomonas argentinensis]KAB0551264.1 hypothetical protein F7R01_08720 [Pseudomonas argentinensis]SFI58365.1 hypothetical protein SAMN05216602_1781 [Pseudomonas argentinensis]
MGPEDREWWREGRRQQGHNASWDNFRAKPGPKAGNVLRIQRPLKLSSTAPYLQLQAQQLIENRETPSTSRILLILGVVAVAGLIVAGFLVI